MTTCSLPGVLSPSSPTEQVPIFFPHDHQQQSNLHQTETGVYSGTRGPSSAGYYVPYNPVNNGSNSARSLGLYSLPRELLTPSSTSPNASMTTRNNSNNGDIVYSTAADRRQPHLVLTNPIDSRRHLHNPNYNISSNQRPCHNTPSSASSSSPLIPPPPLPPTPSPAAMASSPTSIDSQIPPHEGCPVTSDTPHERSNSSNNHIYDEILVSGNGMENNGNKTVNSDNSNNLTQSEPPPPVPPRPSRSPPSIPQR